MGIIPQWGGVIDGGIGEKGMMRRMGQRGGSGGKEGGEEMG